MTPLEAWATRFIKSVIRKYVVVFIGYSADDPPVKYLLEALSKNIEQSQGAYSFQSGSADEAKVKWEAKGVFPILYNEQGKHKKLWNTLEKWSERARDINGWYDNILKLSNKQPDTLHPYERGQVAHVVSSAEGAKRFSESIEPPSSTWICVLDPSIRFSKPWYNSSDIFDSRREYIDPFNCFGLDSDIRPPSITPGDYQAKREIPPSAWNCFHLTERDKQNLTEDMNTRSYSILSTSPKLPIRLIYISKWIVRVSNEPAIIWWVAGCGELHPIIQEDIKKELYYHRISYSEVIRKTWILLFQSWKEQNKNIYNNVNELKNVFELSGWTDYLIREIACHYRPRLIARKKLFNPTPPKDISGLQINELVKFDVKYPDHYDDFDFPDIHLTLAVKEMRYNVEKAVIWEDQIEGFNSYDLESLEIEPDSKDDVRKLKSNGLTGCVKFYLKLFKRLIEYDIKAAKKEYSMWLTKDHTVFARLRIWVAGNEKLISGKKAGELLYRLDNGIFWDRQHQCDLLITLKKRWDGFPSITKKRIEKKLLKGPVPWKKEGGKRSSEWKASAILNRIYWLNQNGCIFTFDFEEITEKLRLLVPKWKPQYARDAARSLFETRVHEVKYDFSCLDLLNIPLNKIISRAGELREQSKHQSVERRPFAGLVHHRPYLAFSALCSSSKRNEYHYWAWQTFFCHEERKNDKPKFFLLIIERIVTIPQDKIASIIYPLCNWLRNICINLYPKYRRQFEKVWISILKTLRATTDVQFDDDLDILTNAINSPVGILTEALLKDPILKELKGGDGFPNSWIDKINELLLLQNNHRRNALTIATSCLNWFYFIDPIWSKNRLFPIFSNNNEDQDSFWVGFLSARSFPSYELFKILKPHLLKYIAINLIAKNHTLRIIPLLLLEAWIRTEKTTGERWIDNREFRTILINTDDEFRLETLSYLDRKVYSEEKGKKGVWRGNLHEFLQKVWPRQQKTKSSSIIGGLFDLAFIDEEIFEEIIDTIIQLMVETNLSNVTIQHFRNKSQALTEKFPVKVLEILDAILLKNTRCWPYAMGRIINHICKVEPTLVKDKRMVEFRRLMNSR